MSLLNILKPYVGCGITYYVWISLEAKTKIIIFKGYY